MSHSVTTRYPSVLRRPYRPSSGHRLWGLDRHADSGGRAVDDEFDGTLAGRHFAAAAPHAVPRRRSRATRPIVPPAGLWMSRKAHPAGTNGTSTVGRENHSAG